jgi:hypothetical protein
MSSLRPSSVQRGRTGEVALATATTELPSGLATSTEPPLQKATRLESGLQAKSWPALVQASSDWLAMPKRKVEGGAGEAVAAAGEAPTRFLPSGESAASAAGCGSLAMGAPPAGPRSPPASRKGLPSSQPTIRAWRASTSAAFSPEGPPR